MYVLANNSNREYAGCGHDINKGSGQQRIRQPLVNLVQMYE